MDIELYLSKKFEGCLFAHITLMYCMRDYSLKRSLYTVKDGKVCEIQINNNNNLYPTGDRLIDLETKCHKIGRFNPNKNYKTEHKTLSYSELRKILKSK